MYLYLMMISVYGLELNKFVLLFHPAGRELTSDWTENNFTMVVFEKIVTVWTENSDLTFKINFS